MLLHFGWGGIVKLLITASLVCILPVYAGCVLIHTLVAYWGLTLLIQMWADVGLSILFIMRDRAYNYRFGLSMYWAGWLSDLHRQGGQELGWAAGVLRWE